MAATRDLSAFRADVEGLFRSGLPLVYCDTQDDEQLTSLLVDVADGFGASVFQWAATSQSVRELAPDGEEREHRLRGEPEDPVSVLHFALGREPGPETEIWVLVDAVHEEGPRADAPLIRWLKDVATAWRADEPETPRRMLVLTGVGWTPPTALAGILQIVDLPLPTREEIAGLYRERCERNPALGRLVPVEDFANRAVGLGLIGIRGLVRRLEAGAYQGEPVAVIEQLKRAEVRRTQVLEVLTVPERVDLGGFQTFRAWFGARRPFLTRAVASSLQPRGVLFAGFPGCGKSLAARWIARQLDVPLVSMDVGRIQDRWVGSSEARMRTALRTLEATAPAVLLIDEIEKAISGHGTDSSGVTTRLVGQLLTWLQEQTEPIFVVATCNRPDMLPAELTRAGRFDANFVVRPPDRQERGAVVDAVLRELGRQLTPDARTRAIEETELYSGAELRQLVKEAVYEAGPDAPLLERAHLDRAAPRITPLALRPDGQELLARYTPEALPGYLPAGVHR